MKPMIITPFDFPSVAQAQAAHLNAELADIILREFPDGETYVKFEGSAQDLQNKDLIIIASLDYPNPKILPLLLIAETAKALGAKRVGLCAPYLAYMRQDKQFHPGEGVTSEYFATLLSRYFDWLVTVDPHLHRHHDLGEIYAIPATVLHAAPQIASWIANEVQNPLLIGPDAESEQWVSKVAQAADVPYLILEKTRHGDVDVEVSSPAIAPYLQHTPVLVDDIISTAQTMIETVNHLKSSGMQAPVCVGVHAVFAGDAYNNLLRSGAGQIVTCNTIRHPSNQIDLLPLIFEGVQGHL